MIYKQFKIGGDRNFAYLTGDQSELVAAVIDPAYHPEILVEYAEELKMKILYVISTHGHPDHTNGNAFIVKTTGAKTVGHPQLEPDIPASDGFEITLGKTLLKIIHTPGHTPDAICILANNQYLFTGDTLFAGKVGGTGSKEDAKRQYHSLHKKIMSLPEDIYVLPGHDYGVEPVSTIGMEKRTNPFLLRESFDQFLDLKLNWADYKRKHGIK